MTPIKPEVECISVAECLRAAACICWGSLFGGLLRSAKLPEPPLVGGLEPGPTTLLLLLLMAIPFFLLNSSSAPPALIARSIVAVAGCTPPIPFPFRRVDEDDADADDEDGEAEGAGSILGILGSTELANCAYSDSDASLVAPSPALPSCTPSL